MTQRHLSFVALLAVGALLSGCSGGVSSPSDGANHSPDSNQNFTFSGTLGPVDSIHVELPKGLLEAMGSDADNILVKALDLKAHKLDSAKYCAVDITRTFAKGAVETLSAPAKVNYQSMTLSELWNESGDRLAALAEASGVSEATMNNLVYYEGLFKMPAGPERDARFKEIGLERFDVDAFNAGVQKLKDDLTAEAKNVDPKAMLLKRMQAKPLSELNEASPEPGRYMSDDGSVVTDVMKCAVKPFSDSSSDTGSSSFWMSKSDSFSPESFASFRFTVMKDGKITITDSGVDGYQQDSSGNWLKK